MRFIAAFCEHDVHQVFAADPVVRVAEGVSHADAQVLRQLVQFAPAGFERTVVALPVDQQSLCLVRPRDPRDLAYDVVSATALAIKRQTIAEVEQFVRVIDLAVQAPQFGVDVLVHDDVLVDRQRLDYVEHAGLGHFVG